MKNFFKITDAKIMIAIALFFIGGFVLTAFIHPTGTAAQPQPKNFVGIDAAGYAHYPNGESKLVGEIKF